MKRINFKGAGKNIGTNIMNAGLGYGVAIGSDKLVDWLKPDLDANIKAAAPAIVATLAAVALPGQTKKFQGALDAAFTIGIYRLADNIVTPMLTPSIEGVNPYWNSLAGMGYSETANTNPMA